MGRCNLASNLNLIQPHQIETPADLFNFAKAELITGVKKSNHPFHTCVVGTVTLEGNPSLRTVVSRGINDEFNQLRIHSDQRSKKNIDLLNHNAVSVLYYSHQQKLQVRLNGRAKVFTEGDENTDFFASSSPHSQLCYGYPIAPGEPISQSKKELIYNEINVKQLNAIKSNALAQFSHIIVHLEQADILWLNNRGHVRIFCELSNNIWNSEFIVA